jgi:hypothetical protein
MRLRLAHCCTIYYIVLHLTLISLYTTIPPCRRVHAGLRVVPGDADPAAHQPPLRAHRGHLARHPVRAPGPRRLQIRQVCLPWSACLRHVWGVRCVVVYRAVVSDTHDARHTYDDAANNTHPDSTLSPAPGWPGTGTTCWRTAGASRPSARWTTPSASAAACPSPRSALPAATYVLLPPITTALSVSHRPLPPRPVSQEREVKSVQQLGDSVAAARACLSCDICGSQYFGRQ